MLKLFKILSIIIAFTFAGVFAGCGQIKALSNPRPYPSKKVQTENSAAPLTKPAQTAKASPSNPPAPSTSAPAGQNSEYFTKDETVNINADNTDWLYISPDLYIHITKYEKTKEKLRYYVADIRTRGNQMITSGFSDSKHPGTNALLPYLVARRLHAVFLQNGDFFEDKRNPTGIIIRQGRIYLDGNKADTLAVMPDGTLKIYAAGEANAAELIKLGVKDTFSFGPTLIKDGVINPNLNKERLRLKNPRSGIGMIDKGHYIAVVVEGRNQNESRGVTLADYAKMFADQGCTVAYNLDGGASSAMVFMGGYFERADGYTDNENLAEGSGRFDDRFLGCSPGPFVQKIRTKGSFASQNLVVHNNTSVYFKP